MILIPTLSSAYAQVEQGKNFDREFLGHDQNNAPVYQWTSTPERILDYDGIWKNYRLTETSSIVQLETGSSGSIVWDKNTCSYNFYNAGLISESSNPVLSGISWTVKGKQITAPSWSNLNGLNNAVCVTSVQSTPNGVTITGTRTSSTAVFQIELDHAFGRGIKETMKGYNNNTSWNNHVVGFTETFTVPRVINLGNQTFDLADYNQTRLDRTWIDDHMAQLVRLSDKIKYDMGIGYDNLDSIFISWNGTKAQLSFDYLFVNDIVPYGTWIEIDPTFGYELPTSVRRALMAGTASASCSTTGSAINSGVTKNYLEDSGGSTIPSCSNYYAEFDISSIPANVKTVTQVRARIDVDTIGGSPPTCHIKRLVTTQPSTYTDTAANAKTLFDSINAASNYVTGSAFCQSVSTDNILTFSSQAHNDVVNARGNGTGWFAYGNTFSSLARTAGADYFTNDNNDNELEITYTLPAVPDAVTDLTATEITSVSALLEWTEPGDNGFPITGYQVNYSAGGGDPQTVVENDTESTATSYTISGLTSGITNSFRIGAWNSEGLNASGNTATLAGTSFEIGNINVTETNPQLVGIRFERTDVNGSAAFVNVTYADTYDLACDLHYVYAQTNQTYTNMVNTTAEAGFVESTFLFLEPGNEVIEITCWDQTTNDTGRYVVTQTDFLLLQQIRDFRAGEFGTGGLFGVIDMVTLVVVILAMIGFNRLSESVGAIFSSIMIGVLGYFEIIDFPVIFFGALAIVIMLAIFSTRKD